jgi:hypothetical protein
MPRSQTSLAAVLFVLSAIVIATAWWLLHRSGGVADLKQGFGDIEEALGLQGEALILHFIGALLLALGVSVARPLHSKWVQLAAWLSFLPVTYLAFLVMAVAATSTIWGCAR